MAGFGSRRGKGTSGYKAGGGASAAPAMTEAERAEKLAAFQNLAAAAGEES